MRSFAASAGTALLAAAGLMSAASSAVGQARVQFPPPNQTAPALAPVNPGLGSNGFSAPSAFQPPSLSPPGAYLGGTIQPFDPYALPGNAGGPPTAFPPTFPQQPVPQLMSPPASVWSGQPPPSLSVTPLPQGPIGAAPLPRDPYGRPTDPNFQGSPYSVAPGARPATPGGAPATATGPPYQRLFQDTGLRGTYLHGKDKDDLSLTEAEVSTTAYLANFLGMPNGLRVTPGFVFHWTSGPTAPETSDVPARLYSAYLDFGIDPQFNEQLGMELTARAGLYTDFQAFDSDSIRLLGTAVGVYQASSEVAWKAGVAYIDRVDLKLLPAAGILWTPNPQTRWDIFFPAPKLSNYWTTMGNRTVWWYVGGEYGGGSWSIEREEMPQQGLHDRIDINDIRIYGGIEWWNLNRYYAFAEVGFVFDREVVYYRVPGDSLHVDNTFMVRGGVSW